MSKSVVTGASPNLVNGVQRTWNGTGGTMHEHFISFADGNSGTYSSKEPTQNKFVVGQETEYEYKQGNQKMQDGNPTGEFWPGTIKPVYANAGNWGGGNSGGGRKADPDTMLLSYCKDLAVARINNGFANKIGVQNILDDYEKMKAGFEALNKTAAPVAAPAPAIPAATPVAAAPAMSINNAAEQAGQEASEDKLPF